MSLYKRGRIWWCGYTKPDGERIRESTGTDDHRQALEFEAKRKAAAWRVHHLGEKPRRSWEEAVVRYLEEKVQLKSLPTIKGHLRWLDSHLRGKCLDEIDADTIASIRKAKSLFSKDDEGKECISNPSTVNRTIEVVEAVLRKAWKEWEWLDRIPHFPMYAEPKGRVRWITVEEVERLLAELPQHQRAMALFDLNVGVRQANVRLLEWAWVDMERQVVSFPAEKTKNGDVLTVPLNEGAMYVLEMQRGMHPKWVFPYRGRAVKKVSTRAWREALARAGIQDFHWHDLRHTWASWLRQKRVPLDIIQALGGWRTGAMVQRYAHLDVDHLREHVGEIPSAQRLLARPKGEAVDAKAPQEEAPPTQADPMPSNVVHVTFSAQRQ